MKKMDLKLVVTDDNDKDNTLSLFVPIQNGEDYVSSIELLNAVGEFISTHLPNDNKNILSTNNLLDYYIFKNKNDLNSKRKEVRTQKDMLNKKTSNFSRDSYFNYLQKEYGEEEIEQGDITINIIKLTISDKDRKLINEFKEPINPLRYDFIINKSCKELVSENRCAAENLELVNDVVREYIAINSGISELSKREMIENELHATVEDAIILDNYVNRKYICNSKSVTPRRYAHRHKDKQKENNSKKKELFQKTSPISIVIDDSFNKDKTSFIINRFTDSEHGLHYGLYLYGRNLVSTRVNNSDVFYKVISVNDNVNAYIDIGKDKLCSENLYISELSILKIMERFDISFKKFREEVLTYDGEDYCIEEILEKEIANPELRSHQLNDINKAEDDSKSSLKACEIKIKPDTKSVNFIELDIDDMVYFLKMSDVFENTFTDSKLKMKDLLEKYKLEDLAYVIGYLPDGCEKKVIIEKRILPILEEVNKCLDLTAKKIKIKEVNK